MSLASAKAAGAKFESDVVAYLKPNFKDASRLGKQGAKDKGDVGALRDRYGALWCAECKSEKTITLSTYMVEVETETKHAGAHYGMAVIRKRGQSDIGKSYVVMTLEQWVELFGNLG